MRNSDLSSDVCSSDLKPCRQNFTSPAFASAMEQERLSSLLIHVRFQLRQTELILAPPDVQSLLLSELVRNDHLALLELWRALNVNLIGRASCRERGGQVR